MDTFEEFVHKAIEQLNDTANYTHDTRMLRGIGYALLAVATAIKEKKNKGKNS